MDLTSERCPDGFWPVYKGESFDIWQPDTGRYYAWADPGTVLPWIQQKRVRSHFRLTDSVHREFPTEHVTDESTLAALHPRILFRDVARATDNRTVIPALVPAGRFRHSQGTGPAYGAGRRA